MRAQEASVMRRDRLSPKAVRMVKEFFIGPRVKLMSEVQVAVLDKALCGEQIKRFVARYGRAPAGPDVDGEEVGDEEQEKEGCRAERQPSSTDEACESRSRDDAHLPEQV